MKIVTFAKMVGLSAAAVVLGACSIAKPDNNTAAAAAAADNGPNSAQAYRMQTAANGEQINALKAPANQTYYFNFDKSEMQAKDLQALNIQANYLATHPNARVRLEGNTDDRGSREYNIGLGWRRDQAVARYMEQQGVSPKQIQMVSYGKERPAVLGENNHAWMLNRRVNLVYKTY